MQNFDIKFRFKLAASFIIFALLSSCFRLVPTEQLISGPVNITQHWIKLSPPVPLRSEQSLQQVFIELNGITAVDLKNGIVTFENNEKVKIEAEVLDEFGKVYKLIPSGYGGRGGLYLARESTVLPDDMQPRFGPDFPDDRVYKEVRIRSDKEMTVDKVLWICSTNY